MGEVVAAVPGVEEGDGFDGEAAAVIGMDEAALELVLGEGLEHHDPAGVEAFDELEGPLDWGGGGVMEGGPGFFVVRLDGGPVLGEGEADAGEGVHVAVGHVVDELADGPAAFAVGGGELVVVQAVDGVAKLLGKLGERADGLHAVSEGDTGGREGEAADGITHVPGGRGRGAVLSHGKTVAQFGEGAS